MIIDFHMHAFPDRLAGRTLEKLSAIARTQPQTDGTIAGTLEKMAAGGVDYGVILQIATRPGQETTVNNWAAEMQTAHPSLFFFGSVHPDCENLRAELRRIRELGLKGVKLHPDYQGFFVDDPKLFPLYEELSDLGLPLIFHAGRDPFSPNVVHAAPKAIAAVAKRFPQLTLIGAHMGGLQLYEESMACLADSGVYIDTSMSSAYCDPELFARMVARFGAERILFGTDSPWGSAPRELAMVRALPVSEEEKEKILWRNAARMLQLEI